MKREASLEIKRRKLLKTLGVAVSAAPLLTLAGCGASSTPGSSSSISNGASSSSGASGSNDWAGGGTASLQADFPPISDPFDSGMGNMCTVTKSYTLGPCYFNPDEYRQDISEGEVGIPMVLVLKLVDVNCQPIAGADIDIWHCDRRGIYSGDSAGSSNARSFNSGFCTGNNNEALASRWFRGVQTTDEDGLVYFKTCFPGWYPSRTSHIHFKVVHNGVQSLVSQFCFDDDLCNKVYLNHSEYTGRAKDTSNAADNVFGSDYEEYEIVTERQADNSMLGYKAIQLS
ncbi:MAG: hypothetical protein U5M23_01980 [Marinagarivorans sp.]|nr:hypothetical protein [Marinagarivorans sp.]